MKRLLLLRHAKAVQDGPGGDKARALNTRGREDAARMGAFIHVHALLPDRVLCSSARRTVETWERLSPELDRTPDIEFPDGLYLASWKAILTMIRATPDFANTLLVIAHNPGLEECALALARKPCAKDEQARFEELHGKFPTCALAVLDCDIAHWRELGTGANALAAFVRAKSLKNA